MGLIDDVAAAARGGADAAGRAGRAAQLRARLADLGRRRERACAELGASLYRATAGDASLREGREAMYGAIESIDGEVAGAEAALAALAAPGAQAGPAGGPRCPSCGAPVREGDAFCGSCGAPVPARDRAQATCPACGADAAPGAAFCGACGAPLAAGGTDSGEGE